MPYLFLILALLVNPAEARDYSSGIRQAERSCQIEQSSQLRNRNGTPSCELQQGQTPHGNAATPG